MSETNPIPADRRYIPGFAWAKLGLAAFGIVLIAASLTKFAPFVHLMVDGESVSGEAVRVRLIDIAGHERVLATQAEVLVAAKAAADARDRSTVFWVEYRFALKDGRTVEARANCSSRCTTCAMRTACRCASSCGLIPPGRRRW
jgi:hypothetical protein